jgi:hypothetical protein
MTTFAEVAVNEIPKLAEAAESAIHTARSAGMQFNLFDWIREGVRRSVILGVSDAMEAIGAPDGDEARARLAPLLAASPQPADALSGGKRKRLGRSLRDFDGAAE